MTVMAVVTPEAWREFRMWWTLVWQLSLCAACRTAMMLTDSSVLGHISTDYLAASSLANVWMYMSALFLNGFGDAIRTLGAQAWGAGNYTLTGLWLQSGLFWITVLSLPIAGIWMATKPAMHVLGIADNVADLAQTYANWSLIGLWPRGVFNALDAYLQTQGVVVPQMLIALFFVGVNLGLNWLLVHGGGGFGGLGFIGSPIATSLSTVLQLVVLLVVMRLRTSKPNPWPGWTSNALSKARTKDYLKQAVPVALAQALEEWQMDVITGFVGHMGATQVATHNAVLQIFLWLSSVEMGIMRATSVRVGFHLGNRDIPAAKRVVKIAGIVALVVATTIAVTWICLRNYVGDIFSSDPDVQSYASHLAFLCGGAYLAICVFYVCMGILEGQGRPLSAALAFVVGSWFVCLPLAYVFGFTLNYNLYGVWYALVAGYGTVTIMAFVGVFRGNWTDAMNAAVKRSAVLADEAKPLLPRDDSLLPRQAWVVGSVNADDDRKDTNGAGTDQRD